MTTLSYIDIMGAREVKIEATVLTDPKRVLVDYENLCIMVDGILSTGITGEQYDIEWAKAVLSSPVVEQPEDTFPILYDVTGQGGGGWADWYNMNEEVIDALTAPKGDYFDHFGNPTTDPRCELGLCVDCLDAAIDQRLTKYRPSLSIGSALFMSDPVHRAKVIEAYRVAGIEVLEDLTED